MDEGSSSAETAQKSAVSGSYFSVQWSRTVAAVLREIPGLSIPDDLLKRVEGNNSQRESLAITLDLIDGIRSIEGISGIHIRSIRAEDWVPRIITAANLGGEMVY